MRSGAFLIIAALLAIITIANIGFYAGRNLISPVMNSDDFMIVRSVIIQDSPFGQDPVMAVDRQVVQTFRGKWTVEVNTADGQYVCSATDETVYTPDARMPETVRLFNWWMLGGRNPENLCLSDRYPLEVGCYYVDTVWEAVNMRSETATIFNRSNEFCVRPRE